MPLVRRYFVHIASVNLFSISVTELHHIFIQSTSGYIWQFIEVFFQSWIYNCGGFPNFYKICLIGISGKEWTYGGKEILLSDNVIFKLIPG